VELAPDGEQAMLLNEQLQEIVQALAALPPDKIEEVRDFVLFLHTRHGKQPLEELGDWSEEDMRELSLAVWKYAEQTIPWDDSVEDPSLTRQPEEKDEG
jgi:hypothetical protein